MPSRSGLWSRLRSAWLLSHSSCGLGVGPQLLCDSNQADLSQDHSPLIEGFWVSCSCALEIFLGFGSTPAAVLQAPAGEAQELQQVTPQFVARCLPLLAVWQ